MNACCERGEDDFMYPMPPEWLHAINRCSTVAASAETCGTKAAS
ncbi:MAG: hypothetical protein ACLR3C_07830 [Eggerthella lenta]